MQVKRTAFYEMHRKHGAKIVEFAGFEMPVQYSGIVEEHRLVRERVGVFDVSHMGEFEVRGSGALDLVQRMTVNDAAKLAEGRVQYSAMCYEDGGIVDDLLVYNMGDHYMLVVNAANTAKDLAWIREHAVGDVTIEDRSDEVSLLAVQGPKSLSTLQKLTPVDLSRIAYYHFTRGSLAGVEMVISRTGYTGELGFELYFPADVQMSEKIWGAVMEAGKEFGIGPVGLGARDTLRLEMGFCLYGNDIDKTTNPIEAGLGWITKVDKGDFLGRGPILEAKRAGVKRKLVGFSLEEKAFPRHGYQLLAGNSPAGTVTSGTYSPILERGIGMGYVETGASVPGTRLAVAIRDRKIPATVVSVPFVKK